MIIVWRGFGILIPFIAVGYFMLIGYFQKELSMGSNMAFSLLFSFPLGAMLWVLGRKINQQSLSPLKKWNVSSRHSFFWLGFEIWSVIAILYGFFGIFKSI